jgi:hypothetical protein
VEHEMRERGDGEPARGLAAPVTPKPSATTMP